MTSHLFLYCGAEEAQNVVKLQIQFQGMLFVPSGHLKVHRAVVHHWKSENKIGIKNSDTIDTR